MSDNIQERSSSPAAIPAAAAVSTFLPQMTSPASTTPSRAAKRPRSPSAEDQVTSPSRYVGTMPGEAGDQSLYATHNHVTSPMRYCGQMPTGDQSLNTSGKMPRVVRGDQSIFTAVNNLSFIYGASPLVNTPQAHSTPKTTVTPGGTAGVIPRKRFYRPFEDNIEPAESVLNVTSVSGSPPPSSPLRGSPSQEKYARISPPRVISRPIAQHPMTMISQNRYAPHLNESAGSFTHSSQGGLGAIPYSTQHGLTPAQYPSLAGLGAVPLPTQHGLELAQYLPQHGFQPAQYSTLQGLQPSQYPTPHSLSETQYPTQHGLAQAMQSYLPSDTPRLPALPSTCLPAFQSTFVPPTSVTQQPPDTLNTSYHRNPSDNTNTYRTQTNVDQGTYPNHVSVPHNTDTYSTRQPLDADKYTSRSSQHPEVNGIKPSESLGNTDFFSTRQPLDSGKYPARPSQHLEGYRNKQSEEVGRYREGSNRVLPGVVGRNVVRKPVQSVSMYSNGEDLSGKHSPVSDEQEEEGRSERSEGSEDEDEEEEAQQYIPSATSTASRHGRTKSGQHHSHKQAAPVIDDPRRYRTAFSVKQLAKLEEEYAKQNYVTRPQRFELAATTGLLESTIKIWFQNRRMKEKRQRMTLPPWGFMHPADPRLHPYGMNQHTAPHAAQSYPGYPGLGVGNNPSHPTLPSIQQINYYNAELQRAAAALAAGQYPRTGLVDNMTSRQTDYNNYPVVHPSFPGGAGAPAPYFAHIPGVCPTPMTGEPCLCHLQVQHTMPPTGHSHPAPNNNNNNNVQHPTQYSMTSSTFDYHTPSTYFPSMSLNDVKRE